MYVFYVLQLFVDPRSSMPCISVEVASLAFSVHSVTIVKGWGKSSAPKRDWSWPWQWRKLDRELKKNGWRVQTVCVPSVCVTAQSQRTCSWTRWACVTSLLAIAEWDWGEVDMLLGSEKVRLNSGSLKVGLAGWRGRGLAGCNCQIIWL